LGNTGMEGWRKSTENLSQYSWSLGLDLTSWIRSRSVNHFTMTLGSVNEWRHWKWMLNLRTLR
jgi:hypothetical protein